jgi:hypothetical protein
MSEKNNPSLSEYSSEFRTPNVFLKVTTISGLEYEFKQAQMEGDLKRIGTKKNINEPAGTFELDFVAREDLGANFTLKNTKDERGFTKQSIDNVINLGLLRSFGKTLTFKELFRPMTLIDIYIDGKEVMLGVVDSVRKNVIISETKPQKTVKVTGRDLGSILIDHKIWYDRNPDNSAARGNFILAKPYATFPEEISENIQDLLKTVYENWMKKVVEKDTTLPDGSQIRKFTWSNSKTLSDLMEVDAGVSQDMYCDEYNLSFKAHNFEGAIWDFMKQFVGVPLNEIFVDTGGRELSLSSSQQREKLSEGKCHLICRPTPYDDEKVLDLDKTYSKLKISEIAGHTIDDRFIVSKDLGYSRVKMYTIYMCYPMAGIIDVDAGKYFIPPTYDPDAIPKYAHNPLEVVINGWDSGKESDFTSMATKLQEKLYQWYRNRDEHLYGSIVIKGRSDIRVGQRLDYRRDPDGNIDDNTEEGYYYITAVNQDWIYGEPYKTTLTVDRGIPYQK